MRVARVYVAQALTEGAEVTLDEAASEHLGKVLRVGVGQEVTAFDGSGPEWRAVVRAAARHGMTISVIERRPVKTASRSPPRIVLLQSLARGEKMDWVIQKCTELGVARILPIAAERSVLQLQGERVDKRLAHWRAIAIHACEQSGRRLLPSIEAPSRLDVACTSLGGCVARWLLEPRADRSLVAAARGLAGGTLEIAVLIGPEGGFSDAEYATARQFGFEPVRLGPRVLRTETAAVATVAAVQVLIGDLDDVA